MKAAVKKELPGKIFIGAMLIILYLPILVLAFYSFTTSANIGSVHGFSMDNYVNLAFGSSLLAAVLGTLGAIGAFYSRKAARGVIGGLNEVPVINADVVTGFSVCIMLVVVLGIDKNTFVPLVIGHVVLSAPFVYLSVTPKLKQMDSSLYEAAMDLGATPRQALTKVVLPQIQPGIVSGFALAVTLSLDDYFIASYTKPATFDTISTYVVNATKGSQTEIKTALWALSTLIFLIVVLAVVLMNLRGGKEEADFED